MQENIIKKITIKLPADFKEVLNKINENELGIVFVIDDKGHLIGSISDGDIRRAMLKGMNLEDSISMKSDAVNRKPFSLPFDSDLTRVNVKKI